jgi:DNA invertase Pin-like site-specific DNA recombinase
MNLAISPGSKPLAFSYIRLSSRRQKDGDGFRRQTEAAAAYCEQKGLTLDHTLSDIGVSGFTGANRIRGVLARFLELAKTGRIPTGSHLIVENLDRLSRDKVMIALRSFSEILEAGIIVHTVADGQVYDWESANANQGQLFLSLAIMGRAHDESKMKLFRQRANWENKRANGRVGGLKLTARGPSWLKLNSDRTEFEVMEPLDGETYQRGDIIKRIFKESEQGIGCDAIARRLNADGIRPFSHGRTWHGGTVRAYLTSIAVRGHYQPNRMEVVMVDGERTTRRVPDGEVITNYYPVLIDDDQWNRTWAAMDSRRMAGPTNLAGRKGSKIANLFGNLARCMRCGEMMNIRDRGQKRRNRAFFMCSGSRAGTCEQTGQFVTAVWEPALLEFITELDLRETDPVDVQNQVNKVAALMAKRDGLSKRVDALLEMVVEQGSARARELAGKAERDLEVVSSELCQEEDILRRMRSVSPPEDRREQMRDLMAKMAIAEGKDLYAIRASLQASLREIIEWVRFGKFGEVFVAIKGGKVAYLFRDARLIRRLDEPDGIFPSRAA